MTKQIEMLYFSLFAASKPSPKRRVIASKAKKHAMQSATKAQPPKRRKGEKITPKTIR